MLLKNCSRYQPQLLPPFLSRGSQELTHLVISLVLVVSVSLGTGCSQNPSQSTSPTETLSAMLELASEGNWEKYIDEYYGEQHKFKSPSDREQLVSRFREKWGSKVIVGLKEASQVEPELSQDENQARFKLSQGELILYKNEQGKWTFHLS